MVAATVDEESVKVVRGRCSKMDGQTGQWSGMLLMSSVASSAGPIFASYCGPPFDQSRP